MGNRRRTRASRFGPWGLVLAGCVLVLGAGAAAPVAADTSPSPMRSTPTSQARAGADDAVVESPDASGEATPTEPEPSPSQTPSPTQTQASPTETSTPTESPTATESATASASPSASAGVSDTPTPTATVAGQPPAVVRTNTPVWSIVVALLVLVVTAVVLWVAIRRSRAGTRPPTPPVAHPQPPAPPPVSPAGTSAGPLEPVAVPATVPLMRFLVELGEAMLDAGDPVSHVTNKLEQTAAVAGASDAEIVVLPTALIVSVPGEGTVQTEVSSAGRTPLRLDQIEDVYRIVDDAAAGDLPAEEGLARLERTRAKRPIFGPAARLGGYILLTLGLALVLHISWLGLGIAAVLGALVGVIRLVVGRVASGLEMFLPIVCAALVTAVVMLIARTGADIGGMAPMIAPLVAFIPGAMLTTGVIDLSTGQMISGAGRLAAGIMQLIMLALGIIAGTELVGVPATGALNLASVPAGPFAPWIGVGVFGIGVIVFNGSRVRSLPWIMLVLYVAYAGQVLGGLFFGAVLSGFFGAAAMTIVAMFVATQKSGPPTMVSFLPAYWILVPGSLGLIGMTRLIGQETFDGMDALATSGATMIAIAFGVLLGLTLGTSITNVGRDLAERLGGIRRH